MQQLGAISQSTQAESDTVCYGFQITDLIEHGYDPRPDLGELLEAVAELEHGADLGMVLLTMSGPAQEGR